MTNSFASKIVKYKRNLKGDDLNCKSFMYSEETRSCILSDERSQPLGRAQLTPGGSYDYYEKKCYICEILSLFC